MTPSFFGAFGCFFEAVGFAVDCDDLGVVDKAIDQGGDAGRGGKDLAPFGECLRAVLRHLNGSGGCLDLELANPI